MVWVPAVLLGVAAASTVFSYNQLNRGSWTRILLSLVAIAGLAVLVLLPRFYGSTNVILIVDSPALLKPASSDEKSVVRKLLLHLREGGSVSYMVIRFDPTGLPSRNASGSNNIERLQQKATFSVFRNDMAVGEVQEASGLSIAIENAVTSFENQPVTSRLFNLLSGTSSRIILVCSSSVGWQRVDSLDVPSLNLKLHHDGVRIDLLHSELPLPSASLSIEPNTSTIVPSFPPNEVELTLRLVSPDLNAHLGEKINWQFEGFIDQTSPTEQCRLVVATRLGESDGIDYGQSVVQAGGVIQLTVGLRDTIWPSRSGLTPGFHLVRCSVITSGLIEPINVESETYIQAVWHDIVVVAGNGNRFALNRSEPAPSEDSSVQQCSDILDNDLPGLSHRQDYSVRLLTRCYTLQQYLQKFGNPSSAPFLLVLHDLSDGDWADPKFGHLLSQQVRAGTHLLVSGLPCKPPPSPALEWADLLPAFALPSDLKAPPGASIAPPWRVERSPRVTFVIDDSGLGSLPYAPTPEGPISSQQLEPSKKLSRTVDHWELPVIKRVCANAGLACPRLDSLNSEEVAAEGVQTAVCKLSPGKDGEIDRPLSRWLARTSVSRRLLPLLPDEVRNRLLAADPQDQFVRLLAADAVTSLSRPAPADIAVNDILVVFCHDVPQASQPSGVLRELICRGATIILVPIHTPYDTEVRTENLLGTDKTFGRPLRDWVASETLPQTFPSSCPDAIKKDPSSRVHIIEQSINTLDQQPDVQPISDAIVKQLKILVAPRNIALRPVRYGRFFDERLSSKVVADSFAAPQVFQVLDQISQSAYPIYACGFDAEARDGFFKSGPWPLIVGGNILE